MSNVDLVLHRMWPKRIQADAAILHQLMKPHGPQKGAFEKATKFIGPPTATATEYVRRDEGNFEEIARQAEEVAANKEADYERRAEEANILLNQEENIWVSCCWCFWYSLPSLPAPPTPFSSAQPYGYRALKSTQAPNEHRP
ncbi:unnamed protein product [Dibothriocephalus latus]|uniref:Uncharacterized protein n=1 Tax=Dibothriocephalus latus TaxID=60516 RepID=A0A3P6QBM6_DIBLA|nr:unnamed protein product [Dibothriocephalus latus]